MKKPQKHPKADDTPKEIVLKPSSEQLKGLHHVEDLLFTEQGIRLTDTCLKLFVKNKKLKDQCTDLSIQFYKMMNGKSNATMFYALVMTMANLVYSQKDWIEAMENDLSQPRNRKESTGVEVA